MGTLIIITTVLLGIFIIDLVVWLVSNDDANTIKINKKVFKHIVNTSIEKIQIKPPIDGFHVWVNDKTMEHIALTHSAWHSYCIFIFRANRYIKQQKTEDILNQLRGEDEND